MTARLTRRRLLQSLPPLVASAATLGDAASPRLYGAEPKEVDVNQPLPIVDTHVHLWDLDQFDLPWIPEGDEHPLARSFLMPDYLRAAGGLELVQAIYMEVNVRPDQQVREAEYVLELCRRDDNPLVAAVVGGSPQEASFAESIERLARAPEVKGVRSVLHDADRPQGMCLQPRFVENMRRLGDLGLSFDLCMRPGEIGDGVKLAERCPGTRFIIDHCGNMPIGSSNGGLRTAWQQAMKAAAGLENVVCKISGIVVTAPDAAWTAADLAPNIEFCLETFGEDRVFFGGDWPVCTLRATLAQWAAALREIVASRTPAFQRKLFHDNAVRFYGLA